MSQRSIFGKRQSWPGQGFFVATEYFYVATKLAKARKKYVATKQCNVTIELAMVGKIFVATEDLRVATELATTKKGPCAHNRIG